VGEIVRFLAAVGRKPVHSNNNSETPCAVTRQAPNT